MNTLSTGAASRPALSRGAVRGHVAILALFLVAIMSQLSPQTSADENKSVNVSNLSLTRVDGNNIEQDGKLSYYDLARLSFDWSGVDANLKSGDSFTIGLGEYFTNLQNSATHPMTVEYGGKDVEVGSCTLTVKDVTCTFNSKVDELKAAGFHNFKGTGSALVAVDKTTDAQAVDLTANGVTTSVTLPGGGGIGGPQESNWELTKWASSFYNNYKELTWGVNFGTNQTTGDKLGKTFDGSRQTIVFTDTLGGGMSFNQTDATRTVLNLRPADGKSIPVTNAAGQDSTTQHGDFDVKTSYSQDGRTATYEVTGPFQNGTNFTLEYPVSFVDANGNAVAATQGAAYENTVNLQGTDLTSTQHQSYVQYFDISVQMEPGFGTFDVTKVVQGGAAAQAAGSSFVVDVAYELPAAASSYPDWKAPEGQKATGESRTGTSSVTVKPGEPVAFGGTFPVGTKITLSEDTSKAQPAASGYSWGEPAFTVDGQNTNTFTIRDQQVVRVSLTNTTTTSAPPTTYQLPPTASNPPGYPPATTAPPTTTQQLPPSESNPPATVAPPSTPGAPQTTPAGPVPPTSTPKTPTGGTPPLAHTGANTVALLLLAGAGVGGGALLMARRRKAS
ncbi:LPXTG-motif protein cell wall anchor domain protein [Actinomyces sp. oral taxon 170 str. F0386]|nr:LPXTG-motif protein cell wall anchor domain protein [Actinomyces sp. oral taxon 170 str. F0386]